MTSGVGLLPIVHEPAREAELCKVPPASSCNLDCISTNAEAMNHKRGVMANRVALTSSYTWSAGADGSADAVCATRQTAGKIVSRG